MEIYGADCAGIEGRLIRFTATRNEGRCGVNVLGLAGKVVKEGIQRAVKAIETLKGNWSSILNHDGYTIDLSPAELPKTSSGLDLPIAIMLLQASILQNIDTLKEQIAQLQERLDKVDERSASNEEKRKRLLENIESLVEQQQRILKYRKRIKDNNSRYLLIGKLDITTGKIEAPMHGVFGMIAAARPGFTVIAPEASEVHASIVAARHGRMRAAKATDLQEVWDVILGESPLRKANCRRKKVKPKRITRHIPDLRDIDGVSRAKRAMTVALAGGHNILLVGPPGQGKTMLASAATKLLPDLNQDEMFELNKIYSAKGDLLENEIVVSRPFREMQNATEATLLGGGRPRPVPGEVSLAHRGVLLFDEINLCQSSLIEKLRNTLNDRYHRVQRVQGTLEYPCHFILVAAMNPCRCGYYEHFICEKCEQTVFARGTCCPQHPNAKLVKKCNCTRRDIEAYRNKLSRPMMDRIDLKVLVSSHDHTQRQQASYASVTIKRKIMNARKLQNDRLKSSMIANLNADIPDATQFRKFTPPVPPRVEQKLEQLDRILDLTKRMQVKLRLVARTIADVENVRNIRVRDVDEAVDLMGLKDDYFRSMT